MTILVCLAEAPETWWQARTTIGDRVLGTAEMLAADEEVRKAIFDGRIFQTLSLYDMEPGLRERVWHAVEDGARAVAADTQAQLDWPPELIRQVQDLAHEMEARR